MRCGKARKMLLEYTDSRLPRPQSRAVGEHLGACPECALAADDLVQARRLSSLALHPEPRPGLTARVMARIESGSVAAPSRRLSWRFALSAAGVVAMLIVGGLIGYFHSQPAAPSRNDLAAFAGFCVSNHSALPEGEALVGADESFMPAAYEDQRAP